MAQLTETKIKPLGNRVVLQRSQPKTSQGGILLPDTAKEKPKQGLVLATGPGKRNEQGQLQALQVKVGDEVMFSSYAGVEITLDDQEVMIIAEDDILAVLPSQCGTC